MYSMTGYGKGEYRGEGVEVTVEIKSVNNRFLDVAIKSPRIFAAYEEMLRTLIREKISRGHVDVFVSYTDKRERGRALTPDLNAVRAYVRAAQAVRAEFPELKDDLSVSVLLKMPDVMRTEETTDADGTLKEGLEAAMRAALEAHAAMRRAEGERLKADLIAHAQAVAELRDGIAERAPLVAEEYRKNLTARMQELLGGKADENRILTEAAVYSDKCCIDEELTRLASHLKEFAEIVKSEAVGRKLDFLIQEFNRECNTVCSKSNDTQVTALALKMKNEIEKIREQVQNLE